VKLDLDNSQSQSKASINEASNKKKQKNFTNFLQPNMLLQHIESGNSKKNKPVGTDENPYENPMNIDLNKVGTPSFNQKANSSIIDRSQNTTPIIKEALVQPSIIFNKV
jgi:hypothetical protein